MPRTFTSVGELQAAIGEHLGYSEWLTISQHRIDTFAEATGDRQWIHVDAERAAAGPYGATIAHGYLAMSLVPVLVSSLIDYAGWRARINYGSQKVRFPSPVPVGSRVRAGAQLVGVRVGPGGTQVTNRVIVEIQLPDGGPGGKPAVVAETITLLIA